METSSTPEVKEPAKAQPAVSDATATNVPDPKAKVEEKPKNEKVSLADLAKSTSSSSSEPNRAAIDRQKEKDAAKEKEEGVGPGRGSGQTGKKRGPYKTGTKPEKSKVGTEQVAADKAALEKYELDYKAGAEFIDGVVTYGAAIGGPTWYWRPPATRKVPHPQKPGEFITIEFDERTRGTDAFGKLFAHYGWGGQASPLVGVAFFCLQYAQIRLKDPEVREKALSMWDKLKLWGASRKMKADRAKADKEKEKQSGQDTDKERPAQ